MSKIVFTPASIEAFKRTARDVQSTCGNSLQQCQEALAQAYGYQDLHALQEHLKTKPKGGPYPDEVEDIADRIQLRMKLPQELLGSLKPVRSGPIGLDDLGITERPEVRAAIMEQNRAVTDLLEGSAEPEPDNEPSAYFWFEHDKEAKEGVLRRTAKGDVVDRALQHLNDLDIAVERLKSRKAAIAEWDRIDRLREAIVLMHPNNPYALAGLLISRYNGYGEELPAAAARALWPEFRRCREMFERVVPRAFRQSIEPKLVGHSADNYPYIQVLFCGAVCAELLGFDRVALAWARKGRMLNKNDNFGFRFLIAALE